MPSCVICGSPVCSDALLGLCEACSAGLDICGEHVCDRCGTPLWADSCSCGPLVRFDTARSVFVWEGPVRDIVLKLKYARRWDLARLMGDMMAATWRASDLPVPDVVVPVPIRPGRFLFRGYNQSALLAKTVARHLKRRSEDRFLVRVTDRGLPSSTKGSSRRQRILAAEKSFKNTRKTTRGGKTDPVGLDILLVDDVMTTGATTSACANCLKKAGATRVNVITFAKAVSS